MTLSKRNHPLLIFVLCSLLVVFGCVPSQKRLAELQAEREFENQVKSLHTIGLVPLDVNVFELLAGGERELMNESSGAAGKNLSDAIRKELAARSISVKNIQVNKETLGELEEIHYLYRAINESLLDESDYKKLSLCSNDLICPDYSVGPIEGFLKSQGVDALLAVYAYSEVETEARTKAREKSRGIAFASAFAPIRILPLRNAGMFVSMALIDKNGAVLWYGREEKYDKNDLKDLRSPEATVAISKEVVEKLFER